MLCHRKNYKLIGVEKRAKTLYFTKSCMENISLIIEHGKLIWIAFIASLFIEFFTYGTRAFPCVAEVVDAFERVTLLVVSAGAFLLRRVANVLPLPSPRDCSGPE